MTFAICGRNLSVGPRQATGLVLGTLLSLTTAGAAQAAPALLSHQAPLELDGSAAGWILTSTALVLLMTLPGLALFYGGMVRRKNVIATITQSLGVAAVVTLAWFAAGYSLSFGVGQPIGGYSGDEVNSVIGSLEAAFLRGVTPDTAHAVAPALPEYLWIAFQMTFAIITPALVTGAFAERLKYSACCCSPVCGPCLSMRRSVTGSGAAASWDRPGSSTLPAGRSCTSTRAWPAWSVPCSSGPAGGTASAPSLPTIRC